MSVEAGTVANSPPPGRLTAFLDRWFGPTPPPTDLPDGLPRLPGVQEPENLYLLLALVVSIAVAMILEWIISAAPVPPGGDPGQWISSSYPYINRPYPSQVIFFGYPPLLFPLLGLLVVVGGSAIAAGQLFIALGTIILGLSTYVLARSLLRRPLLALLVTAFVLFDAPFMRLFFFGGYPTVLAIVFMQLSFAFGVRWVACHRPSYLFFAWVLLAATILTHSLVGLLAVGAFGFTLLVLFLQRSLPREVVFSRAGAAGLGVFISGVGGYYLATRLLKIQHPNYLSQNNLGRTKTSLAQLLYPLHLNSLPGLFGHAGHFSSASSYGLAVAFVVIVFFTIAYLASRRRLSVPVLLQGSFILAVIGAGVAGWTFSIVTDYRRFAYFLYIPVTLGVAYIFDFLLGIFLNAGSAQEEAPGLPPLPPRKPRKGPDPIAVAILIVGVGGLAFLGYYSAIPEWQVFENQFTGLPHSQYYLNAIGAINHAGLSGSVMTDNTAADRWTRALTDRNTYDSAEPTDFVFYASQILDDEETQFAFHNMYGVTDGYTYASINTLNPARMAAFPAYTAWSEGVPSTVFRITPNTLMVDVKDGKQNLTVPAFSMNRTPELWFPNPHAADMILGLNTPYYNLTELIEPLTGTHGFSFDFQISAISPYRVDGFSGTLNAFPGGSSAHNASGKGQAGSNNWTFASRGPAGGGSVQTNVSFGNFTGNLVERLTGTNREGGIEFIGHNNTTGLRELNLTIYAASGGYATNLITHVPPILSTPDLLLNWSARYLLMDQNSAPLIAYYTTEYHAVLLASYTYWSVYTLPLSYPPTPYGTP